MKTGSKHILIVANTSWNIHNFRLNVIRALLERDYQVTVLAPVDEYVRYKREFPLVEHCDLRKLDRDSINPHKDLKLMIELYKSYKSIKPDLIIHYTVKPNIYGGVAARVLGMKSVAVVTGLGYPFIHRGVTRTFTKLLYRLSNRFHRKVIFENRDDLKLFEQLRLIEKGKGVSIKGCGVDSRFFSPDVHNNGNGSITFTFIGRLLYDKGVREFVKAAQIVKANNDNVKFWLIGQIDEENPSAIRRTDLVKWVKDPDISYLGSKNDVRPYIAKSDCIVLPSYREAIARSLTEAMSMGKPVIGTDTAGVREAIGHGDNGFLVKVKDYRSLAIAMGDFLAMSDKERTEMGQRGRVRVLKEFDDRKIAEDLTAIVEALI